MGTGCIVWNDLARAARFHNDRAFSKYPVETTQKSITFLCLGHRSRTLPRQNLQSDPSELEKWLGTHARAGSRLVGHLAAIGSRSDHIGS